MKETDSRLQDLKSVVMDSETEHSYNFAFDTVFYHLEQDRTVPALYQEGQSVAVKSFETPSKAMEFLRATKEKWDSFIEKCREKSLEGHKNAKTGLKGKGKGKWSVEQEKPFKSLTERFKGWWTDKAKERAEKKVMEQEQERKRAEERARAETQKRATLEKINNSFQSYEYQARLEQLDFVVGVYRANRETNGDRELREQSFKKLGTIAGVKTREYDPQLDFYVNRDSQTVPLAEIEGAVQKTKQNIHQEKAKDEKRVEAWAKFKELQENNREKIAEVQRDRQTRSKPKSRDMER